MHPAGDGRRSRRCRDDDGMYHILMKPLYVTLSPSGFHFGKMYMTQWDIHFLRCPLPWNWGGAGGRTAMRIGRRHDNSQHVYGCQTRRFFFFRFELLRVDKMLGVLWRVAKNTEARGTVLASPLELRWRCPQGKQKLA